MCVDYSSNANAWFMHPNSTKEMALDTRDLMDHLGWTSNVHVVGVSMGGMIALELACLCPEYMTSLCLTSTHAGRTFPPVSMVMRT